MKQKAIAVDIDDVLSFSAEAFAHFSNRRWATQLTAEDYGEDLARVWGVSIEEAKPMAEVFLTSGIHGEYKHFEDAVPVLRKLSHRYRLLIVTSRRQALKSITDAWVERHFKGIFDEIVYAGFFDNPEDAHQKLTHTKAQLCRELGVDFLIDDQPKHCLAAAECGIEALLFGDYSWNRDIVTKPKKLTVVHSWQEVGKYFDGKS